MTRDMGRVVPAGRLTAADMTLSQLLAKATQLELRMIRRPTSMPYDNATAASLNELRAEIVRRNRSNA